MSSLFRKLFKTSSSVKRELLMYVRRCGSEEDEKWAEKAVETLMKKLNKKSLQQLLHAISNSHIPSGCVTIPRTVDGRIQVQHRKMLPHLIYCQIWRWPDLRSYHELKPINTCNYPFVANRQHCDEDHGKVCINPYHYQRVESPRIQDVAISKNYNYLHHQQQQQLRQLNYANRNSTPINIILPQNISQSLDVDFNEFLRFLREDSPLHGQLPPKTVNTEQQLQPIQSLHRRNLVDFKAISYSEVENWATITYYELNSRVGEAFQCKKNIVVVDGYTKTIEDGARFCLGKLSNVHRNSAINNVRQNIGRGITLHYFGGEVYIECNSDNAFFVQSRLSNYQHNFHITSVVKVQRGRSIKIFDTGLFADTLEAVVHQDFAAAYELIKVCIIRLSFIKGWGAQYHRSDVTETPCWIEIIMNGPLIWLDRVLSAMGCPTDPITSVS